MDTTPFPIESHTPVMGQRALFPQLQHRAYLSHAAISPLSKPVLDAMVHSASTYAQLGVEAFGHGFGQRRRLKTLIGNLFNVSNYEIAFVPNTTSGLSAIALCLPWQCGDRIIVFDEEFPTNVTPWQRAAEVFNLEICWASSQRLRQADGPDFSEIDTLLQRGARLMAISAVQFQTGVRMPIEALGRKCQHWGAELCVDAIQALGATPIELQYADYICAGGHKWMMGPEGTGILLARPGRAKVMKPLVAGWLSHTAPTRFLFNGPGEMSHERPIRPHLNFIESGTLNALGLVGLEASLRLIAHLGIPDIFAHTQRWHSLLSPELKARDFTFARPPDEGRHSSILSVRPPPSITVQALADTLLTDGISCSTPDGWLRFAPHWPNAVSEVPHIIESIDACLSKGGSPRVKA
ncbi:MAG: aminotransferase class V-fold PLP-dependent enzyme [Myxococcota bacterium]|nr:aminotransferase class V-fold PLP-dependent enzyme [Myxococcota bacterium]